MSFKKATSALIPPRIFQPSRTNKLLPYLAFTLFCVFIFKVDMIISQTASASRRSSIYSTPRPTLVVGNGTFHRHFLVSWGHARILEEGEELALTLSKTTGGSGFDSKKEYLFGKINMQIKLIAGNSAGTVTTYYLSSHGDNHDGINFEFMGNSSGEPYTLHTNVFTQGKGEKQQLFYLWFDPTQDFHTYSILWNPKCIIFYVDDIPIREYKNAEHLGVPYPKDQAMRLYSSLWNADEWATQGGRVKTDWTAEPFVASYRNFSDDACVWYYRRWTSSCSEEDFKSKEVLTLELDEESRAKMKKLQKEYMVYDYCKDDSRFPNGPAPECSLND